MDISYAVLSGSLSLSKGAAVCFDRLSTPHFDGLNELDAQYLNIREINRRHRYGL
jgi:hypothetical protein